MQLSTVTVNSKSSSTEHVKIVKHLLKLLKLFLKWLAS